MPPPLLGSETRFAFPLHRIFRRSIWEGASFSLMVGLGETYLPAFVLALGLGDVISGLIASVPPLVGAILQLISPRMVRRFQSYKRWLILCATLQAISFLPLILAAWFEKLPTIAAFCIATIYWASGMSAGSTWNAWMGSLIPQHLQKNFFTVRTRWTQITALIGFIIGGFSLHYLHVDEHKTKIFGVLFLMAAIFRLVSIRFLYLQPEGKSLQSQSLQTESDLWVLFKSVHSNKSLRSIFRYLLAVHFSTYIAAPFFTPFMFNQLNLTYTQYAVLTSLSYLAKVITLPWLGRFAHRFGTRSLVWFGGLGIVWFPILWLKWDGFAFLALWQILAGFFWAAYELGALLLLLESIEPSKRPGILGLHHLGNAFCMGLASTMGGFLLQLGGVSYVSYATIFVFSSVCRLTTLLLLNPVAPHHSQFKKIRVVFWPESLRPNMGFFGYVLSVPDRLRRKKKSKKDAA